MTSVVGVADRVGYTIEPRCRAVEPPEHREHRALALGKKGFFFDPEWRDFLWANLLPDVIKSIPPAEGESGEEPFQIVATASKEVDLATQGVINLGMQNQADWNKILVSSKVLVSSTFGNADNSSEWATRICRLPVCRVVGGF